MLYLPTEEELKRELERERDRIEQHIITKDSPEPERSTAKLDKELLDKLKKKGSQLMLDE